MQFKRLVPLKKVILHNLGKEKSTKYLQGISVSYSETTTYSNTSNIYQDALTHLYNGDMDKAINYVIFGLDIERDNKLLFNLCKNMAFLLSKHLSENNSEIYRQKYGATLDKAVSLIKGKLEETEINLENEQNDIKNLGLELVNSKPTFLSVNKFFITHWFKKRKIVPKIKSLEIIIKENNKIIKNLSHDMNEMESFVQVEEDVKVLGLIIEVCVFPTKFEWLLTKQEKKPENVV